MLVGEDDGLDPVAESELREQACHVGFDRRLGDITVLHEATQLAEGDQYLFLYSVEPGSPSEDAMHLLESMVATQAEQERSNLLLA